MKNISLILNGISITGVIILFFMYSSLKEEHSANKSGTEAKTNKEGNTLLSASEIKSGAKIAYVNIDSLDQKYEYIRDYSETLRKKQAGIEASLSSMYNKFQQEYADFQQSVQAGLKSEAELKKQQAYLEQKQGEIAAKEKSLQSLGEEVAAKQNDMLKNVSAFISKYNKGKYDYILAYTSNVSSVLYAKPDFEITNEVINGLNEEYRTIKNNNPQKK